MIIRKTEYFDGRLDTPTHRLDVIYGGLQHTVSYEDWEYPGDKAAIGGMFDQLKAKYPDFNPDECDVCPFLDEYRVSPNKQYFISVAA